MSFSHFTIRTKLTIAFGGLALMVLIVAGLSLKSLNDANDRFAAYVSGINARANMAAHLRTAVDRRAIAARNLVLVTKPADMEKELALVTKAHGDVQTRMAKLNGMMSQAADASDKARDLVKDMDRIERAYTPVALAIVDLVQAKKKDEAIAKMNDECRPLLAALAAASTEYAEYTDVQAAAMIQASTARYADQRNILLGTCMLVLLAAVLAGVFVTRSITRPMAKALAMAESVAAGDLTPRIEATGSDEVSQLLAALGRMNRNLGDIVTQVRQSSDSIATGSTEIATGNADLSQRTEEQASALQETAASMDQLNATVRQNADNARHANELAVGASSVAIEGGAVVGRVVTTMKEINDGSKRIAAIISVIDGIAFQTNILALNAAVEAARAGEQGRGFAVVAGEVRGLASRCAEAAREIKELIVASVERVEQGTALVDEAGTTMAQVVTSIKRVADIVSEISAASVEQSAGVAQVNNAVSEMDRTTQQNAALVEESAAAAESLRQQSQSLVQAVAVFKVSADQHDDAAVAVADAPRRAAQVERRAPTRATNVVRPAFKSKPATAAKTVSAPMPAKTGTDDDWEAF